MQDGKNLGTPSILKLIDNSEIGEYADYPIDIVKFKKGQTPDPTDDNSLWWISYDDNNVGSFNYNKDKCSWTENAQLFVGAGNSSPSTVRTAFLLDIEDMTYTQEDAAVEGQTMNGVAFSGIGCLVYFSSEFSPTDFSYDVPRNLWTWSLTSPDEAPVYVGAITGPGASGIAFSNGSLYASSNFDGLYRIDPSLDAELLIPFGLSIGGIASDSSTGIIYGTNDSSRRIVKFDLDNGTIEPVADYPAGVFDIDGLAAGNGLLYLVIDRPGNFYVYDLAKQEYVDTLESPFPTSDYIFSGAAYVTGSGLGEN
jgi:hypothetical protein